MCVVDADASLLAPSDLEELGRRIGAAVHNGRAYETALASLRAREQVLSAVSHDLQNPLSTILMSAARMLQDGEREGTTARPQLERIHRSAARMRRLVGDLLDVAAIESGALAINPTDCSLADLAREVIDGATVAASDAGVTLVDEIAESDHRLHADPERALQVLRNLVGNAIKFTPPGGTVTLRAFRTGTMVAVQVVDTGIGIADSELHRIFDRFWQAEPARRLGTGLGLAICKSLVERWDGTIRASSVADAGTTITFTVPRADEGATADRSA
jgi:signal transduction histidine kinase